MSTTNWKNEMRLVVTEESDTDVNRKFPERR